MLGLDDINGLGKSELNNLIDTNAFFVIFMSDKIENQLSGSTWMST